MIVRRFIIKTSFLFLTLALVSTSCKKEPPKCYDPANPDCENYDPCYGVEKLSAAFVMEDVAITNDSGTQYIAEDSIFRGTDINFRSTYTGIEFKHTWYVGSQVLNGWQVSRSFFKVARPTTITIRHVLEYPPDTACFPEDDGIDSVSQTFYLIEYWDELATFGTFRVANESSTDSFDFRIRKILSDGSRAPYGAWGTNTIFLNFNNNQDSIANLISYFAVNTVGFIEGIDPDYPSGKMVVNPTTKEVKLEFSIKNQSFIQKGRKLK